MGPAISREVLEQHLAGTYAIERELGGGGMSSVFVGREIALDRRVVLKVVAPELAGAVSIERFQREIQLLARLQHPNIVPVLQAGSVDGMPFFTMPFVHGESLRIRLGRDGKVPQKEVVEIAENVATALAYAHGEGVVHRDMKPDNILMSGGKAMLTDFGIATAVSDSTEAQRTALTAQGVIVGTPAYMAPEQVLQGTADARSDIYSLGVTLYELLSGRTPFETKTPLALAAAHAYETPPPLSEVAPHVTPALRDVVMSCLAKDPAARPQNGAQLAERLRRINTVKTPAQGWLLRNRRRRVLLGAAPAIAAGLMLFAVLQPHRRDLAEMTAPAQLAAPPDEFGRSAIQPATVDSLAVDMSRRQAAARADSIRLVRAQRIRDSVRAADRMRRLEAADRARMAALAAPSLSMPRDSMQSGSSPGQARIRIASGTPNSTLYVDNQIEGLLSAPRIVHIPAGRPVRLSVRADGCTAWDSTVTVDSGAFVSIGRKFARC